MTQTRRRFLNTLSLAGAAAIVGVPSALAAEVRLETRSVRLTRFGELCLSPQYVAEELLRAEGFPEVSYDCSQVASTAVDECLLGSAW